MSDDSEANEAKPKKKSKLLLIIIILVVLIGGGVGGAFALGLIGGGDKQAEKEEPEHTFATFPLDTFIVNTADGGYFLKITIHVKYDEFILHELDHSGESGGGHGGDGPPAFFAHKLPEIRDGIIDTLAGKTSQELFSNAGKETLKEELVDNINERLEVEDLVVVGVYFSEFIIQ